MRNLLTLMIGLSAFSVQALPITGDTLAMDQTAPTPVSFNDALLLSEQQKLCTPKCK